VGKDGIEYFVQALKDQPVRFYYTVSPLCGLTPSEETYALTVEDSVTFLERSECVGLGEVYWGNLFLSTAQSERIRKVVAAALAIGKRVEGHSAGARGRKLQAYADYGISSCHEATTEEEFLERLRLGYWTMIREGAIRKELEALPDIFTRDLDLRRLILTTDGLDPEEFITQGYLDASVRRALKQGAVPNKLYQTVTLNAAEHFRLDHVLGSISPVKYADLVFIPSPDDFSPQRIICGGKTIFANGKALVQPRQEMYPESMFKTVKIDGFHIPALPQSGKIRALEPVTRLVTKETIVDLDDKAQADDLLMILSLERRGRNKAFMGFLKQFGLQRGACGSTMCWDSVDMIVAGKDVRSMETVINRLQDLGGGAVYAINNDIVAEFPAPLCGVVSLAPMAQIREEIRHLEAALSQNGVPWEKPLLTLDTLGSAAIPHLRITHEGYVRLKDREVLSWKV
jgi:adenine deaminase